MHLHRHVGPLFLPMIFCSLCFIDSSALQCLNWLICSGLMERGRTVVRYDDWIDTKGGKLMGEKRAHQEITQLHQIVWEHTAMTGNWFRFLDLKLNVDHCISLGFSRRRLRKVSASMQHNLSITGYGCDGGSKHTLQNSSLVTVSGVAKRFSSLQSCYSRINLWERTSKAFTLFACERQCALDRFQSWAIASDESTRAHWQSLRLRLQVCDMLVTEAQTYCMKAGKPPPWPTLRVGNIFDPGNLPTPNRYGWRINFTFTSLGGRMGPKLHCPMSQK